MKTESLCLWVLVLLAVPTFAVSFSLFSEKSELQEMEKVPPNQIHTMNVGPSKDAYILLYNLKKVRGIGNTPLVCKLCQSFFVDAITYDHFCLPDSEGMDGEVCDKLTFLGTTTTTNIKFGCKLLLLRRPFICK